MLPIAKFVGQERNFTTCHFTNNWTHVINDNDTLLSFIFFHFYLYVGIVISLVFTSCVFFQLLLLQMCLRLYFCVHRYTLNSSSAVSVHVLMSHVCAIIY